MKILITGGAGFIGGYLVKKLLDLGHEIVVVDDLSKQTDFRMIDPRCEYRKLSILDNFQEIVIEAVNCKAIIHLAAKISVEESNSQKWFYNRTNVEGTLNMLDIAELCHIPKFIFASSAAVYDPISAYAISKLTGEYYCNLYSQLDHMNTVNLRFFNIYGQGSSGVISKFLNNISEGKDLIINGDGEQTRDYIHVNDVVSAIIKSLTYWKSGTFDIGSGKVSSVNDIVDMLGSFREFEVKHNPAIEGELRESCANIEKARDELGFESEISLNIGLRSMIVENSRSYSHV